MANPEHLAILKQGVEIWNQWRQDSPGVKADLVGEDFREAKLYGIDFSEANLSGADLRWADLRWANLRWAKLNRARLYRADLSGAYLIGADLSRADLNKATCNNAIFKMANLCATRLIDTVLDGATLDDTCLWETQRAGWSIRRIVCESVYWDKERKRVTTYGSGDFERLYSEKTRVLIRYLHGLSSLEIITLPSLIQHLESSHPGCRLRLESIQDASGGAVVTIVIDDSGDASSEQGEELRAAIQSEAEQEVQRFRLSLKEKEEIILRLEGQVQAFQWTYKELLLNQKQNLLFITGGFEMGDEYNVSGQAGAIGPNAHAHDMTFNQIGSLIEKSMDLAQLADELSKLRQEMSQDANDVEHHIAVGEVAKAEQAAKVKDSSKLAESLRASGKWSLDVATKIGVSLASEAIKHSMGMK